MNKREIRGYSILAKGDEPLILNKEEFLVPSQSTTKKYKVSKVDGWFCECKDFKFRKQKCKHIFAVEFLLKMRNKVNEDANIEFVDEIAEKFTCHYCKSDRIRKDGLIKNKRENKQRYFCKDCKKTFYKDKEFNYIRNPKVITLALDMYMKGMSLRKITDTLNQFFGIKIHHETVRRWIMKFTNAMNKYTEQFTPKVSDAWHIDEQMIKTKGDFAWSWNVLDENTRFLIANQITKERYVDDARKVLQKSKETAKVKPEFIITDGLQAYRDAIKKEFPTWWRKDTRINHIRLKDLETHPNNNLIERFHGSFRERDKVMRGFKGGEQVFSDGFRTYYNFIRPHSALNGLTPSQVADIDLQLDRNRWLSLLKQSLKNKN